MPVQILRRAPGHSGARAAARVQKQPPSAGRLLQRHQADLPGRHHARRDAVGRVKAVAVGHGAHQLQHLPVGLAGLVIDRLPGVRWRAYGLGLGPAASDLGVGHHGFELQLWPRAVAAHHRQQVQILFGPGLSTRRVHRGWRQAAGAVQVAKPLQQLGFGFKPGNFLGACLHRLARRFEFFGAGRGDGGVRGAGRQLLAEQLQAVVGGLEHQRQAVFALQADRAAAVAVPDIDLAVGQQCHFYRHLVRLAQTALHLAQQQPGAPQRFDLQAQHLLAAVQRQAARPGARIAQVLKRTRVEPEAIVQGKIRHKNGKKALSPRYYGRKQLLKK